jgi:hypothetical protein
MYLAMLMNLNFDAIVKITFIQLISQKIHKGKEEKVSWV